MANLSNVTRSIAFASMANPYDRNDDDVVCGLLTECCENGDLQTLLAYRRCREHPVAPEAEVGETNCLWSSRYAFSRSGSWRSQVVIDARDNTKVCSGGMTHGYLLPSDVDNEPLSLVF